MPVVVPFSHCIARPGDGQTSHFLTEHLEAVAHACGYTDGGPDDRLGFLAGLLHDAAKCHADWQKYIQGRKKKGPPHAPMGASLFAFAAGILINDWASERKARQLYLDSLLNWTLAIHSHHGKLADLDDQLAPWEATAGPVGIAELVPGCDMAGIFQFIQRHFPSFHGDPADFAPWLQTSCDPWERYVQARHRKLIRSAIPSHQSALVYPHTACRLIHADRTHAADFGKDCLDPAEARSSIKAFDEYCRRRAEEAITDGASPELVHARSRIQSSALQNFARNSNHRFYTLLLPTGFGKTLSALRIALHAVAEGPCRRIVYVAPYISILSQAAEEIASATGLEVFQHHHLSLAERFESKDQNANDVVQIASDQADDHDFDALDTWQAPVLATTFNQFFRALFPRRAQETLRIPALQNTFIIIDEPQIIDTRIWNLFLRALAPAASSWKSQFLFSTATLPPLKYGLLQNPIDLAPQVQPQNRFTIHASTEPLAIQDVVQLVCVSFDLTKSVAVVLNTIRDAVEIYQAVKDSLETADGIFCLTALMLPSHKSHVIADIRKRLKTGKPVLAVCTQVLEAGVDLSFRAIFRARPILPSAVQVAGRANRHAEATPATVTVFPFCRDGQTESRQYVYRDRTARKHTDLIFEEHPALTENEIPAALNTYFERCWQENKNMARLADFDLAASGQWSALAGIEPFGTSPPRSEVFVPLSKLQLSRATASLVHHFAPDGPEQLLNNYLDREFRKQLSFRDRKRLNLALRAFIVPISPQTAPAISHAVNDWLWQINDIHAYSLETGLAHHLTADSSPEASLIL